MGRTCVSAQGALLKRVPLIPSIWMFLNPPKSPFAKG
jgi:hypothetical protein